MKTQRLRLKYAVSGAASTTGNRDLVREWERAALDAKIGLSYSQGKRPAPQISIAALLPQGASASGELLDIYLDDRLEPRVARERLEKHLPDGVTLLGVEEVGIQTASIQSQLRWADYEVEIRTDESPEVVQQRIDSLLAATTWPAELRREHKTRHYDLRRLVIDLRLEGNRGDRMLLGMSLLATQERTARADQVVLALGLPAAKRIHRRSLQIERTPAAVIGYRRAGDS